VLREQLRGVNDLRERQRAGAAHTAQRRRDRTVAMLTAALRRVGGPDAGTAAVAREAGLSLRTVQRQWRAAVHVFSSQKASTAHASERGVTRCLVKRPGQARRHSHTHSSTSPDSSKAHLPRLPEQPSPSPAQPIAWRGTVVQIPGLGRLGKIRIVPAPDPSASRGPPPSVPSFLRRVISASLTARIHLGGAEAAVA
jgi:hypothetical protein